MLEELAQVLIAPICRPLSVIPDLQECVVVPVVVVLWSSLRPKAELSLYGMSQLVVRSI